MGEDFTEAILYLNKDFIYFPMNTTTISLIPKVDDALNIKDFMPMLCYNVTYKVISKLLVNRLMPLLSFLIDENKFAFVQSRNIQDNILLMLEIVPKGCVIKVDVIKAFDTVN